MSPVSCPFPVNKSITGISPLAYMKDLGPILSMVKIQLRKPKREINSIFLIKEIFSILYLRINFCVLSHEF